MIILEQDSLPGIWHCTEVEIQFIKLVSNSYFWLLYREHLNVKLNYYPQP